MSTSSQPADSLCPIHSRPLEGACALTLTIHAAMFFGGEGTTTQTYTRTAIHDPMYREMEAVYQLAKLFESDFNLDRGSTVAMLRQVADALEKQAGTPSCNPDEHR